MTGYARITIPEQVRRGRGDRLQRPVAPISVRWPATGFRSGTMSESDLRRALSRSIPRITGRDRSAISSASSPKRCIESDVRVSLVAERDGAPVGFVMARVDLGEFGRIRAAAVMDTIGVDPDYRDQGIGRALISQLLANLIDAAGRASC